MKVMAVLLSRVMATILSYRSIRAPVCTLHSSCFHLLSADAYCASAVRVQNGSIPLRAAERAGRLTVSVPPLNSTARLQSHRMEREQFLFAVCWQRSLLSSLRPSISLFGVSRFQQ